MAGISVVGSYEWWPSAALSYAKNLGGNVTTRDVRYLKRTDFPSDVDIVVGSPPCTQFSFSNRGGNGDIHDGLRDIRKFLWVVELLQPRFWALENVPRVKSIIQTHVFEKGGHLSQFRPLFTRSGTFVEIFDFSEFGLPQRRRRCIAGNFPIQLLRSYAPSCPKRQLGDIVAGLAEPVISDPIFNLSLSPDKLSDHDHEVPLTAEELRLNRDSKQAHPIYNRMRFPDAKDQPGRAITATCTRVSRESVIVETADGSRSYRRLTLRERACLQGFPVTYQFFGSSYADKIMLIGNALPPLFAYYLGSAFKKVPPEQLKHPHELDWKHSFPAEMPPKTPIGRRGHLPPKRTFQAAIPHLHFKSGVRFEMVNAFTTSRVYWRVRFFFGSANDIRTIRLNKRVARILKKQLRQLSARCEARLNKIELPDTASELQATWTHHHAGITPHSIIDQLGSASLEIERWLRATPKDDVVAILSKFAPQKRSEDRRKASHTRHFQKLSSNGYRILAGLIIGSWFNSSEKVSISRSAKVRTTSPHKASITETYRPAAYDGFCRNSIAAGN